MKLNNQVNRFIIIGVFSTIINFFIFNIFYNITKNIIFSSYLGYFLGLLNSYIFGKIWVFKLKSKTTLIKKILYFIVYFLGGSILTFCVTILQGLGINYKISWLVGLFFSCTNNFLGSKYIIFNKRNQSI